jgi:CBS domain containing-hemolysin-like protein
MLTAEALLILLLVALNGFFAMSELAILCARRARLQRRADSGSKGALIALSLADSPTRFLSTVQIGITLIGILAGVRIPAHAGHRFRAMPVTDSGACRSAFRAMPVRRFDAG